MAIDSSRIAGQPAYERRRYKDNTILPRVAPPGDSYTDFDDNEDPYTVSPVTPVREGQIASRVFFGPTNTNRLAELYVAVDINGTLEWKLAQSTSTINGSTGAPIDPIYYQ